MTNLTFEQIEADFAKISYAWRPIETAPRDGTRVLLFEPKWAPSIRIGKFISFETFEYGRSQGKREFWTPDSGLAMRLEDWLPTHWMPLPGEPPT